MSKKCIIFLAVVCLFLTSCNKGVIYELREYDQDVIFINQFDTVYDEDTILEKRSETADFYELCKSLGIDHMKTLNEYPYTVVNTENGFVLLLSDLKGEITVQDIVSSSSTEVQGIVFSPFTEVMDIVFSPSANLEAVTQLETGMTLNDVQTADPDGYYNFLFTNWSDAPKYSYHYFETGDGFFILYDTDDFIISIDHFTL